jgi:hypothetical protein
VKKNKTEHKGFEKRIHTEPQPFLVYYNLSVKIKESQDLKSVVLAESREESKEILIKKLRRDYLLCEINNIRSYLIRKNNYKGKRLSDKEWDAIIKSAFPNSIHKLYKFDKNAVAQKAKSRHRDEMGRFSEGNTPWNKNLKVQFVSKTEDGQFKPPRDEGGKFTEGNKPVVIGAKPSKNDS